MPTRISGNGTRDMVDLCAIIKKYYYNPQTKGSNSIKYVLPAVLQSSAFVQNKYCNPIKAIGLSSKNFPPNHTWIKVENGKIQSPYELLPPLHENLTQDEINNTLSDLNNINDGGAALIAFGKIQYTDMTKKERLDISEALKRYCELDTLAMAMIYEHLKSLVQWS